MESVNNVVTDFEARVAKAREIKLEQMQITRLSSDVAVDRTLRRESVYKLKLLLHAIADEINYDEEVLDRQIAVTRRSIYGRIPAMLNLVAKIYSWPISSNGNASEVKGLQEDIIDFLNSKSYAISEDMLIDIKETKGSPKWLDDEGNEWSEKEPVIDEYRDAILEIATILGLSAVDLKLTETRWKVFATKQAEEVEKEKKAIAEALKRHEKVSA